MADGPPPLAAVAPALPIGAEQLVHAGHPFGRNPSPVQQAPGSHLDLPEQPMPLLGGEQAVGCHAVTPVPVHQPGQGVDDLRVARAGRELKGFEVVQFATAAYPGDPGSIPARSNPASEVTDSVTLDPG